MAPVHKTRSKAARKAAASAAKAKMTKEEKAMHKNVTMTLVATVLEKEKEMTASNKKRLPKNYYKDLVKKFNVVVPLLNVKSLKNAVHNYKKKQHQRGEDTSDASISTGATTLTTTDQGTCESEEEIANRTETKTHLGRPKNDFIRKNKIVYSLAMNEVSILAADVKKKEGVLSSHAFNNIVDDVKKKRNLPEDLEIKIDTVKKRITNNKLKVDPHGCMGGTDTPLADIEPSIVQMILLMTKLRQPLSSGQLKQFVNSCINGTVHQKRLIEFKVKRNVNQSQENLGKVGTTYITKFLRRWGHLLSVKKPHKFELDRSKWAQYTNFKHMYDCIEDALVSCGVAKKLDAPVWMDKEGNIVETEQEGYGQKCTIDITHPEYCLVGDEVGANTSQKGDGQVGGKKFICMRGTVPQQKASKRDKKYTVIGLTNLRGDPVMCVIIIEGKQRRLDIELGLDYSASCEGHEDDPDFIKKNTGEGKRFPGGPKCIFEGKEVPCFVRFHESGGITGEILLDVFRTMDYLQLFHDARAKGITPFVLMDGHGSRFYLPLVQYLNSPETKYCMSIGVPYGTSFWQVGDSAEQNGSFKVATYQAKEEILEERAGLMIEDVGILPSDIIIIVNKAWAKSFARVKSNRKAIAERGWYPYNRNLLKNDDIRITMTAQEVEEDKLLNTDIHISPTSSQVSELTDNNNYNTASNPLPSRHSLGDITLNLSSGMGLHVLKHIVRETDLATAREEIELQKKQGMRKKSELKDMKKITAATMVKCGEFVIGKAVEDWIYEKELEKRAAEQVKRERIEAKSAAQKLKLEEAEERKKKKIAQRKKLEEKKKIEAEEKADRQKMQYLERFEKAKRVCQEKKRLTWKVQDYRTVLMAMKLKSDGALPSKLAELSECYDNWKHRKTGEIAMEQTQVSDMSSQASDTTFEDTFSFNSAVAEHAQIQVLNNENSVEIQGEVITDSQPTVDAREGDISQNSSDDTSGYTTLRSQILL